MNFHYSRELREVRDRENKEIESMKKEEHLRKKDKHLEACFVENLNGNQLFERIFESREYRIHFITCNDEKSQLVYSITL